MKRIVLIALAAFMMSSVSVFGADMTKDQKDQCLLVSKDCKGEVDSIQKKIKKLDAEIKKGKRVYTAEELKALQAKLDEADALLDNLLKP